MADALRERFPKLAELMDGAREDVLAYMAFPREHWPQLASTNPLERLNGEIKRRADVIGIFPNDRAVVRLVGALMLEQCDEWAVSRRYMSLEALAVLSDDPRSQAVRSARLSTLEPCRGPALLHHVPGHYQPPTQRTHLSTGRNDEDDPHVLSTPSAPAITHRLALRSTMH